MTSTRDKRFHTLQRALLIAAVANLLALPAVMADEEEGTAMPAPATGAGTTTATTDDASEENLEPADPKKQQAATLIEDAINLAYRNREARPALARGAAALLPKLQGRTRMGLTNRWVELVSTSAVPRATQLAAYASFFDIAASTDIAYGRAVAMTLPDPVARASAFVRLSEKAEAKNWDEAAELASFAQRAARQEPDLLMRARSLTYVANRLASLNPETREAAIIEASSQDRLINDAKLRESLLASVVGSAAKFDIPLATRIAESLQDENYKNLALARIAAAQTQASFAVKAPEGDRVAVIVKGVTRYDTSFIPVLLQLPPTAEVYQALGDALPPIYPGALPAIDAATLERIWAFTEKAEPSVFRDQLQSRTARLMVLHDLWRGREWGRKLAWEGGRKQIADFVEATIRARESELKSEPLRALATSDVQKAINQAHNLAPNEQVEALLLIAGQILAIKEEAAPAEAEATATT